MSSDEDVVERERELVGLARVRAQQARHTSYSVSVLANSPMSKARVPVCDEVSAKTAVEWAFASKSNGRHPRQVDDLGARGRGVLRRHSRSRGVATANESAVACDRGRPRDRGQSKDLSNVLCRRCCQCIQDAVSKKT